MYIYICKYVCMYVCMYVYIYIYTHSCLHIYIYIYTCMYMCMCMCVCVYIYIYIYIVSPLIILIGGGNQMRSLHRGMHRGLQLVCAARHRARIGYVSGYTLLTSNCAQFKLGSFQIGLKSNRIPS